MGVSVQRRARTLRQQVGQVFEEHFVIVNRSFFPKLWIKIQDGCNLPGATGSRVLTSISGHQSRSYKYYALLRYRGIFTLGPTMISSGDIFGLFTFSMKLRSQSRLLVTPYIVNIASFPAPFGVLPGGRALRRKTTEVTPYSAGVREFLPGDSLKRIHWPTSARKQKLIVKEFEKDPLAEIWIFLDARLEGQAELFGEAEQKMRGETVLWMPERLKFRLPPSTVEYGISTAASIANYYIGQKREVGLGASGQKLNILPAERGERQLGKILETLALLKMEGSMSLSALVSMQIRALVRGSTVVLITASVDNEVVITANELIQRGMLPVVILIDAETFGGNAGSKALEKVFISQGVIVFRIENGENLASALEMDRLSFSLHSKLRFQYNDAKQTP